MNISKVVTNPFKYKCETCQVFIHPFKKVVVNNGFNTFKVNDLSHVQMLIGQGM
jgi:hypothetical protein